MILECCLFLSKSSPSHLPPPQQIAKSLKHKYTHNLHFPTHSCHLFWVSSTVLSVGPPISLAPFLPYSPSWTFRSRWLLPAPRAPAPSVLAADSSSLFKSHLRSVPLGFLLRSALHAKCFGRLGIQVGTDGTYKSIVLNLHDFR